MGEERKCDYCHHPYHGAMEPGATYAAFAQSVLDGKRGSAGAIEGSCPHPKSTPGGSETLCGCDGRTQWFSLKAKSLQEGEALAGQVRAAGYDIYKFNTGQCVVNPVGADDQLMTDTWMLTAYSDKLPPVASYEEFKQRVGL